MSLPPFPVDDQTLDLLKSAINPDPENAERSSVNDLCVLYSQLGGSDTGAVSSTEPDGVLVMQNPQYHPNDIIESLVDEVRRLRGTGTL